MASGTRERMIEATVAALQRRGVAGMSFTDVLRSSGAARGAIYHHFPGGKTQLVAEAAARNGQDVRAFLAELPAGRPPEVVAGFLEAVRPVVAASAAGGGCAVAAVTMGAAIPAADAVPGAVSGMTPDAVPDAAAGVVPDAVPGADRPESAAALREVAAAAFASWGDQLAERLQTAGLGQAEASDLAVTLITLLEGAHVLCRAQGSLRPFDQAARTALALAQSRYGD
jgi:AcrR family transcriptional regulator